MKTSTGYKTIAATAATALTAGVLGLATSGSAQADEPDSAPVSPAWTGVRYTCDTTAWLAPDVTGAGTEDLLLRGFRTFQQEVETGGQVAETTLEAELLFGSNAAFLKNKMKATSISLKVEGLSMETEGHTAVQLPSLELPTISVPESTSTQTGWDAPIVLPAYSANDADADGWVDQRLDGDLSVTATFTREDQENPVTETVTCAATGTATRNLWSAKVVDAYSSPMLDRPTSTPVAQMSTYNAALNQDSTIAFYGTLPERVLAGQAVPPTILTVVPGELGDLTGETPQFSRSWMEGFTAEARVGSRVIDVPVRVSRQTAYTNINRIVFQIELGSFAIPADAAGDLTLVLGNVTLTSKGGHRDHVGKTITDFEDLGDSFPVEFFQYELEGDGTLGSVPVVATGAVGLSVPSSVAYGRGGSVSVSLPGASGVVTLTGVGAAQSRSLSGGKASFVVPKTLKVGRYALKVAYAGDGSHQAGAVSKTLVVTKAGTRASVRVSKRPTSKKRGKAVVTVRSVTGTKPRGKVTVTLRKGKKVKRVSARVNARGQASVRLPKLAKGTWKFTAAYGGDVNHLKKTVKVKKLKVKK